MIQDILPHRFYNHYDPEKRPSQDSPVIFFREDRLLLRSDTQEVIYPTPAELPAVKEYVYLFSIDEEAFFMPVTEEAIELPDYGYENIHRLRRSGRTPKHRMFAAVTAFQLTNWYHNNRFCGRCGAPTARDTKERAMKCTGCGNIVYPKIVPAVIVGVTDGDRLLMTKYADRPVYSYALIAGFTEIGETLEETVAREVMEEVGLKVKNIRYYKSQPWGIVDDILMGYYCDVDGDPTIRLDHQELKEGVWMEREKIVGQPDDFSLTNEMMLTFRAGREPK